VIAAHPGLDVDVATGDIVASQVGCCCPHRRKLCFATLRDGTGDLQVMLSLDQVGEEATRGVEDRRRPRGPRRQSPVR